MAFRGERYETLRVIASGGMATVHLGRALGAGGFERLVAIKVMHPHLAGEPTFVDMFLDEARLAARIRHPNVVSTLDVNVDDEGVFLVMEYVEGPSLQQIFRALTKSEKKVPLDILLRIFLDTLAGLGAAHELRDANDQPLHLVHRDVSPQNILIGVDGIARITDFGVASAEARLSSTQGGQIKGKLGYMSPEQARAEPLDRRTDLYAAGVILWEALSGGRRFRGGSEASVLAAVASGDHPPPSELDPSAPRALEACCMRALKLDPAERFATAAEFAEAVERAAVEGGIQIVTTRAVAAFVTELSAHARPTDLPAMRASMASLTSLARLGSPTSSRTPMASLPAVEEVASRASPPPAEAAPEEPAALQTIPEARASLSDAAPSSTSAANLVRQATLRPEGKPSSRKLFWGVGAAVIVALVTATFVMQRRDSEPHEGLQARPAEPGASGHGAALDGPSAQLPAAPPSAEPSHAQPVADLPVTGAGADSGRAAVRAPATSEAASGARRKDPSKPTSGSGEKSPVYRPPEL